MLLGSTFSFAQMKFEEDKSFKDLLATAKKEKRLLFVDAYTTWCGPCKLMAKNVFPQENVGDFYNANFINSKIDMEKGEGIEIAKKYNVRAYPTYLFINGDGELIHRVTSYYQPDEFIKVGQEAVDPTKQMGALQKRFEAGDKDPEFLKSFIKVFTFADADLATKAAAIYFEGNEGAALTEQDFNTLFSLTKDSKSALFPVFISRKAEFLKVMPEAAYDKTIQNFKINAVFNNAYNSKTKILDEKKYIAEAGKMMSQEEVRKMLLKSKMRVANANKDKVAYQKLAVALYKDGTSPEFSSNELNSIAWNFFENATDKEALNQAIRWAQQSVKLSEGYANTDTLANLYMKAGDKTNARSTAQKAIELAKKEGEDFASTQKIIDALK